MTNMAFVYDCEKGESRKIASEWKARSDAPVTLVFQKGDWDSIFTCKLCKMKYM